MGDLGYVVIEFNQASGQPRILNGEIWDEEDAKDLKEQAEAETRKIGRRERYAVGTIYIEDEE